MKQGCLLILLLCVALGMEAQTERSFTFVQSKEGKLIAIPKYYGNMEFNIPKITYKSYTPASTRGLDNKLKKFVPESSYKLDERPMDMQILSSAYRPFYDEFAPMLRRVSPMAFDFSEAVFVPVGDNFTFVAAGQQFSWPGIGGITEVMPQMVWHKDQWTVSGGAFAGRYFTIMDPSPGFVGGVNTHITFDASDRVRLKAWGQYSIYDNKGEYNPLVIYNPNLRHSSVGGAVEFKISDDFRVGAGVNYEYNPFKRKMERQILVYPLFGR